MNELSDKISELAESYDPDREHEARAIRAILQGAMCMAAQLPRPVPPLSEIVKIVEVEQTLTEDGDYADFYTIITAAGHRIRVTLSVE